MSFVLAKCSKLTPRLRQMAKARGLCLKKLKNHAKLIQMIKGIDHIGISVVTMCHDGKGNYLISQRGPKCRDEHGAWEPVGSGGVETTETLEDAVRREVKEECGADAQNIEFMGFREVFREIEGKKSHWIAFDFRAEINPSEVHITEPEKCLELRWCTIDTIPFPQHSQFPFFLNKYKSFF